MSTHWLSVSFHFHFHGKIIAPESDPGRRLHNAVRQRNLELTRDRRECNTYYRNTESERLELELELKCSAWKLWKRICVIVFEVSEIDSFIYEKCSAL